MTMDRHMEVILDTNILVNDYFFKSNKFEALFKYLKKANSDLLILDYVLEELKKNYKEDVSEYFEKKEKNERVLINKKFLGDTEKTLIDYVNFLTDVQKRERVNFPQSNKADVQKIFDRSIKDLPPFQSNGKGFKDTLIWMSVVDLVKKNPDKYFAFISANTKDFGSEQLYTSLENDLGNDHDRLKYFNSLEDFLSEYGTKIDFITEDFITEFLLKQGDGYYLNLIEENRLTDYASFPPSYEIDSIENIGVTGVEMHNYFIYGANSDFYKIQTEVVVSLSLDARVFDRIEQRSSITTTKLITDYLADIPLLVNKETKEMKIDPDKEPSVWYPV